MIPTAGNIIDIIIFDFVFNTLCNSTYNLSFRHIVINYRINIQTNESRQRKVAFARHNKKEKPSKNLKQLVG